jgi:hypothetical protein
MTDVRGHYLAEMRSQFAKLRSTAERAMAQVSDQDFARQLDEENNSIAITVKHIAGNLRSRCTDFLTADGEKPDRDRDGEFLLGPADSRSALMGRWQAGWDLLDAMVGGLSVEDVERTVYIRAEPHTVLQALNRHLGHMAYHTGQIVQLAKHWAGSDWRTLTITRGQSRQFTAAKRNGA